MERRRGRSVESLGGVMEVREGRDRDGVELGDVDRAGCQPIGRHARSCGGGETGLPRAHHGEVSAQALAATPVAIHAMQ